MPEHAPRAAPGGKREAGIARTDAVYDEDNRGHASSPSEQRMTNSFIISTRNVRNGRFGGDPGPTRFLVVPDVAEPLPEHRVQRKDWTRQVLDTGHTSQDPHTGEDCGDITVIVHGYNTSPADTLSLHRRLADSLPEHGYTGALVSFDWPSADRAINYLEDRKDAKLTALRLVDDCISLLVAARYPTCRINVHVVAHSMGGYVLREAFDDADDRPRLASSNWNVSQVCLIGADVSAASMSADDPRSSSLYRHCTRLTNYSNTHDRALKLSNVKRIGVAPRVGRHGLPADHPAKAANVDCSDYFRANYPPSDLGHSWYFEDQPFLADLVATLKGDDAPEGVAERRQKPDGRLVLT